MAGHQPPRQDELAAATAGMRTTLLDTGVDLDDPGSTVEHLGALSSTGGAGGVLDLFYLEWKLKATLDNPRYLGAIPDLHTCGAASGGGGEGDGESLWQHPHGDFDGTRALAHVDRIGCRVPDAACHRDPRQRDARNQKAAFAHPASRLLPCRHARRRRQTLPALAAHPVHDLSHRHVGTGARRVRVRPKLPRRVCRLLPRGWCSTRRPDTVTVDSAPSERGRGCRLQGCLLPYPDEGGCGPYIQIPTRSHPRRLGRGLGPAPAARPNSRRNEPDRSRM